MKLPISLNLLARRALPLAAAVALIGAPMLVACSPAASAKAPAAAADSPDVLMTKILASYAVENSSVPDAMSASKYWDPAFTKLDEDNSKLFDGVDVLDADPVCQCQDVGSRYHFTGKMTGPDDYVATVGREAGGGSGDDAKATWQVIWKRLGGKWLIYDVTDENGSIRGLLERHNQCAREKVAAHQPTDACAALK